MRDLASQGRNVIVDHILQEPEFARECADLLADYDVTLVGVHAPLEVLEQREKQRPDRKGHARYQFPRVHVDKQYDFEVDTSTHTPIECAAQIQQYLQGRHTLEQRVPTFQKFHRTIN